MKLTSWNEESIGSKPERKRRSRFERAQLSAVRIQARDIQILVTLYSAFPYWDVDNNCVKLSLANKSNKDILFEVYVNGTQIYIPVKVSPKSWSTQELFVSLEEIITISFSVDKKHICSYNLRNDLTYEKFKLVSTTTKGNDYVYSQLTAVVK